MPVSQMSTIELDSPPEPVPHPNHHHTRAPPPIAAANHAPTGPTPALAPATSGPVPPVPGVPAVLNPFQQESQARLYELIQGMDPNLVKIVLLTVKIERLEKTIAAKRARGNAEVVAPTPPPARPVVQPPHAVKAEPAQQTVRPSAVQAQAGPSDTGKGKKGYTIDDSDSMVMSSHPVAPQKPKAPAAKPAQRTNTEPGSVKPKMKNVLARTAIATENDCRTQQAVPVPPPVPKEKAQQTLAPVASTSDAILPEQPTQLGKRKRPQLPPVDKAACAKRKAAILDVTSAACVEQMALLQAQLAQLDTWEKELRKVAQREGIAVPGWAHEEEVE